MIMNNLPNKIAIFPLSNAVFFPKTILPLNIFEDRYIQLVADCMKEKKMFGMIQPKNMISKNPEIYNVGCLGKIINFNETNDKRFIISLSGVARFRVLKEIESNKLYREFMVDYSEFVKDLENKSFNKKKYDEANLLKKIKLFFKKKNYIVEFNKFEKFDLDQLINTTCMISPFSPEEKQKLIETIKIDDKIKIFEEIINFNLLDNDSIKTIQ